MDPKFPVLGGIANSDILKSYLGLLCKGKNDYEAVEAFRGDEFARHALGLGGVPSIPTLRQRLDARASDWFELVQSINNRFLSPRMGGKHIDFGMLDCGYTPVDLDTFVMNNEDTSKELVGPTYAGVDGYCPLAVYFATQGYRLKLTLRPRLQHSAIESEYNLQLVLPMTATLTPSALLMRADLGLCSAKLMRSAWEQGKVLERKIDLLIKWNPRTTPLEALAEHKVADPCAVWHPQRIDKRECLWEEALDIQGVGGPRHITRRVYRLTERTMKKLGNPMLLPEYILEGWTTTLPQRFDIQAIIALCTQHATHEQFHSQFKSDMDLARLARSEERRVGKECTSWCRSRWSPYH